MRSDFLGKIIRFGLVGASGVVVNAGIFRLALIGGLEHQSVLAQALAIEASILSNYALNARFTFRRPYSWASLGQFNLASAGGSLLQLGVYALLFHGYHLDKFLSDLLAIPCGTAITFGVSYFWVFTARGGGDGATQPGSVKSSRRSGSRS
ncbi:MAG: GtrA family protein [Firmicutes bacterium]|jgi:putative flippase GtrA|nr:GtrA family protein [Bacillota bacterium]